MISTKLRKSTRGAASRILLANAADGVAITEPSKTIAAQVKDQAIAGFARLSPADQDDAGLVRAIDEVCHGQVLGPRRRGPAPFLGSCPSTLPTDGEFSTVIPGPSLQYVIDRADLDRLFGASGATQLSTAGINPTGLAARRLTDPSTAAAARRRVTIGPGQQLGGVVLWLTRRTMVDQIIAHAAATGAVAAELLTDALGLYYPQYNPVAPASNHRYVLHIPAAVVSRRPAFRPTFIEASDYPRFKAKPTPGPVARGWGKTLDLGHLAHGRGLHDGLDEITTWPLDRAAFRSGEYMELQYLGAITRPRGVGAGVDDDQRVAELLMNGRRVSSVLKAAR